MFYVLYIFLLQIVILGSKYWFSKNIVSNLILTVSLSAYIILIRIELLLTMRLISLSWDMFGDEIDLPDVFGLIHGKRKQMISFLRQKMTMFVVVL